jgi:hypothetical protein
MYEFKQLSIDGSMTKLYIENSKSRVSDETVKYGYGFCATIAIQ